MSAHYPGCDGLLVYLGYVFARIKLILTAKPVSIEKLLISFDNYFLNMQSAGR